MVFAFSLCALLLCVLPQTVEGDPVTKAKEILHSLQSKTSADALASAERQLMDLGEGALPALKEALGEAHPASLSLTIKLMQRFGGPAEAQALYDWLENASAPESVLPCMRALFSLDPQSAPERALRLLDHRTSAVRTAASSELVGKLRPEHAEEVLRLSRSRREDTRVRALSLLAFFPSKESLERLMESLGDPNPTAAATSATALARSVHPEAEGRIEEILAEAYLDRAWAYGCLSAAQRLVLAAQGPISIERSRARIDMLLAALEAKNFFVSGAAAVLLAQMGYLADEAEAAGFLDREVPDALVQAVSRASYYKDFNSLLPQATFQLQQISGESGMRSGSDWARWWLDRRDRFRARRWATRLAFSESGQIVLEWIRTRENPRRILFAGHEASLSGRGDEEYRLSPGQTEKLLRLLRDGGARVLPAGAALLEGGASFLFLRQGEGNFLDFPREERGVPLEEKLKAFLQETRGQNLWQLFPDLAAFADQEEFLRSEQAWWNEESKPELRDLRLKGAILRALPSLSPSRRLLGLSLLHSHPRLKTMLGQDDLSALLEMATKPAPGEGEMRGLAIEIALKVDGEKTALQIVDSLAREGGEDSRSLLRRSFLLLGPSASRKGLEDARPSVRGCAAEAFASFRVPGSLEPLLRLLEDEDFSVRRSGVRALGKLGNPEALPAVEKLAESAKEDEESISLLGECCLAVGRIEAEGSLPFLARMLSAKSDAIRQAAVQGLGEMRDAKAATLLAEVAFRETEPELASAAAEVVLGSASEEALPSLRNRLAQENPWLRRRAALLLAELRDRAAIPVLCEMIEKNPKDEALLDAASVLASADLAAQSDPAAFLREWGESSPEPALRMEDAPRFVGKLGDESWIARVAALRALRLATGIPYPRLTRRAPADEWGKAEEFFRKFLQDRDEASGQ